MILRAFFVLSILLFWHPIICLAQTLTLEKVVKSTLQTHPIVRGALANVKAAKSKELAAQGNFDPTIKLDSFDYIQGNYSGQYFDTSIEQPTEYYGTKFIAGYRKSSGDFPVYYGDRETQDDGEVRAGFEIPILRDGEIDKRRAAIQQSSIQTQIESELASQRNIELVQNATNAFYGWIAAGNKLKILRSLLDVSLTRQKQLNKRAAQGDLALFDASDNERSVFQRRAQVVEAERALQQSALSLSLFNRNSDGTPLVPLESELPSHFPSVHLLSPMNVEKDLDFALANRPDLSRLRQQKKNNLVEISLAKNQLLPRLNLGAVAAKDMGEPLPDKDEFEVRGGIRFEIPLFNRSAKGEVEVLEAKKDELDSLEQLLVQRISADIRDAHNALLLNLKRLNILKSEVEVAKKVLSGEYERFQHGDSTVLFVNLREQTAADAELKVVDCLKDFFNTKTALDALTARQPHTS